MDPWAMKPKIKLSDVVFTEDCLDLFTHEIAKRYCAIPVSLNIPKYGSTEIKIAVVDSNDLLVVDGISAYLSSNFVDMIDISFVMADKADLLEYIDKHYNPIARYCDAMIKEMEDKSANYGIDRGF